MHRKDPRKTSKHLLRILEAKEKNTAATSVVEEEEAQVAAETAAATMSASIIKSAATSAAVDTKTPNPPSLISKIDPIFTNPAEIKTYQTYLHHKDKSADTSRLKGIKIIKASQYLEMRAISYELTLYKNILLENELRKLKNKNLHKVEETIERLKLRLEYFEPRQPFQHTTLKKIVDNIKIYEALKLKYQSDHKDLKYAEEELQEYIKTEMNISRFNYRYKYLRPSDLHPYFELIRDFEPMLATWQKSRLDQIKEDINSFRLDVLKDEENRSKALLEIYQKQLADKNELKTTIAKDFAGRVEDFKYVIRTLEENFAFGNLFELLNYGTEELNQIAATVEPEHGYYAFMTIARYGTPEQFALFLHSLTQESLNTCLLQQDNNTLNPDYKDRGWCDDQLWRSGRSGLMTVFLYEVEKNILAVIDKASPEALYAPLPLVGVTDRENWNNSDRCTLAVAAQMLSPPAYKALMKKVLPLFKREPLDSVSRCFNDLKRRRRMSYVLCNLGLYQPAENIQLTFDALHRNFFDEHKLEIKKVEKCREHEYFKADYVIEKGFFELDDFKTILSDVTMRNGYHALFHKMQHLPKFKKLLDTHFPKLPFKQRDNLRTEEKEFLQEFARGNVCAKTLRSVKDTIELIEHYHNVDKRRKVRVEIPRDDKKIYHQFVHHPKPKSEEMKLLQKNNIISFEKGEIIILKQSKEKPTPKTWFAETPTSYRQLAGDLHTPLYGKDTNKKDEKGEKRALVAVSHYSYNMNFISRLKEDYDTHRRPNVDEKKSVIVQHAKECQRLLLTESELKADLDNHPFRGGEVIAQVKCPIKNGQRQPIVPSAIMLGGENLKQECAAAIKLRQTFFKPTMPVCLYDHEQKTAYMMGNDDLAKGEAPKFI